jgi:hypothetical protein
MTMKKESTIINTIRQLLENKPHEYYHLLDSNQLLLFSWHELISNKRLVDEFFVVIPSIEMTKTIR